jgi:hypothetical protein
MTEDSGGHGALGENQRIYHWIFVGYGLFWVNDNNRGW